MVVKNNPIAFLENHGYRWTSDPNLYYQSYNPNRGKKPWGKRDHYEYGINVDSYCGGYHRAYDMVKWHGAGIPAIANATVLAGTGWNTFGWTLVLGFKDAKGRLFQVIYGHLNRNPLLDVRIGQNVKQGQIVAYQGASNNLNVTMNSHLHIQFQNYQSLNEWEFTCLGIDPLNIDVSKSSPSSGATPTKVKKPSTPASKPSKVNKNTNRGRSLKAHFSGRVDSLGAEVRKRRGSRRTGFNWNQKAGYSLNPGDLVYVFEVHDGWYRIYTGSLTGHGSNDWIWGGRVN